ncbi:hypothetical protein [Photobacterium sanctipauli]|nr:hypothetical protein [Photobacterium sanctipauli]
MDQANSLRHIFQNRQHIERVKQYQAQIRTAIMEGDYPVVSTLLEQLEVAQLQLEQAFAAPQVSK